MQNNNSKKVINLIILDESGSMQSIKQPIINGFNEIIQSIRNEAQADNGLPQWVNIFSFNGRGIREQVKLSQVNQLTELNDQTYQPDDNTPLYDSIGHACNKLNFALENETGYTVLVTIFTDGEENSSKEYSFDSVVSLIKSLKDKRWVFTYVGANHDVEKVALSLNISSSLTFNASERGMADYISNEKKSRSKFYSKLKDISYESLDLNEKYFDDDDKK
jgi:hypothetical protein